MRMAALEYRGGWSQSRYSEHELELRSALNAMSLTACGDPRWARHDPPFMPWFLRKNEFWFHCATILELASPRRQHGEICCQILSGHRPSLAARISSCRELTTAAAPVQIVKTDRFAPAAKIR